MILRTLFLHFFYNFAGFVAPDCRYLTEYVTNVDNLYTQKIRQGYLVRAKEIMKKDLHDSMKYFPKVSCSILVKYEQFLLF